MAGLDLDMPAALATAREMGASGWDAAELLLAMRMGLAAGSAARRTESPDPDHPTDAGGVTHGG
ncbi:hypothetical protein ACFQU2_35250 [Siccirubricoccus deserti]